MFLLGTATAAVCLGAEGAGLVKPLFRDFMGINGHTVQFRPQLYRPVATLVRDYHPAEWDLGQDSSFVPRFPFARNGVDWSNVYGSWKREGWRTDSCVMFETLPREKWKDLAADSQAYAERFARVFGPSSLGATVEVAEIGNEPGKFSDGDYRTVFQSMARGFRAGDAALKIASCALTTGKSHDYAKSVACISGLESLLDVLSVHTYAQLEGWPTWRRSFPEDPRLKDYLPDVRRLCEWRDQHAPGKEVWITEFGYDATTRSPDPKTEFKQWVGITEEQQAQWLVRSWLVFSALPVQRAYMFFFNDEDAPQVHGSSGLTRRFQPKPAFHAAAHLQQTLGNFRFARIVAERTGELNIYEFNHESNPRSVIWAAWSPTGNGRKDSLTLPPFEGTILRAESMPLHPGPVPQVQIAPDKAQIELTESPIYVFFERR